MSDLPRLLSSFSATHRAAARRHELHTEATRRRLVRASAELLAALPEDPPALLARQILTEHAEAQLPLPPDVQRRLEACIGQSPHLGRAQALLVYVEEERGLCRPVEVALELGAEPAAVFTFRAAPDAALQAGRVAHVAARRRLLPPGRCLLMWDLPGTRAAEVEGPSLGLALLAATWSATHGVALPETWAFTGALGSQGGEVCSVGHVPAKLRAARAQGCTRVFLPRSDGDAARAAGVAGLELSLVATDTALLQLLGALLPERELTDPSLPIATPAPSRPAWRDLAARAGLMAAGLAAVSGLVTVGQHLRSAEPEERAAGAPQALLELAAPRSTSPGEVTSLVVVLLDPPDHDLPCMEELLLAPKASDRLSVGDAALICVLDRAAADGARLVAIDVDLVAEDGSGASWRRRLDEALMKLHARSIPTFAALPDDPPLLQPCAGRYDRPLCVDGLVSTEVGGVRDPVTEAVGCVGVTPTLAWVVALGLYQPADWRVRTDACVRKAHALPPLPDGARPWTTLAASALLRGETDALKGRTMIVGGAVTGPGSSHPDVFGVRTAQGSARLAGAELHAWLALHLLAPDR